MVTKYVVTQNSVFPNGTESEETFGIYQDAITDAVRKASASSVNATFYVHQVDSRPVYKVERDVRLVAEVIDEGSSDKS